MSWKDPLKRLRGIASRSLRPVDPLNLRNAEPLGRRFGLERGTAIDRYYIESFLRYHSQYIVGRTLEVADDRYSRKYGSHKVSNFDILHLTHDNPRATIVGDLTRPETLPSNHVDCFICTQTLNFIYELPAAVRGVCHVLKPGGVALVTLAGLTQVSRFDMDRWGDYWRVTTMSAERAFRDAFGDGVKVGSCGNVLAATALLHGLAVEDLPDPALLDVEDPDYQVVVTVVATKRDAV